MKWHGNSMPGSCTFHGTVIVYVQYVENHITPTCYNCNLHFHLFGFYHQQTSVTLSNIFFSLCWWRSEQAGSMCTYTQWVKKEKNRHEWYSRCFSFNRILESLIQDKSFLLNDSFAPCRANKWTKCWHHPSFHVFLHRFAVSKLSEIGTEFKFNLK